MHNAKNRTMIGSTLDHTYLQPSYCATYMCRTAAGPPSSIDLWKFYPEIMSVLILILFSILVQLFNNI